VLLGLKNIAHQLLEFYSALVIWPYNKKLRPSELWEFDSPTAKNAWPLAVILMRIRNILSIIIYSSLLISCKQTTDELLNHASQLISEKNYTEAAKIYTKIINRNSRIQLAWYNRGICFGHLNQYTLALRDFNKIIMLKTNGGDYIMEENPDAAPILGEQARMQVPYNDALYQRAQVKFFMDSLRSSFTDFQTLINANYQKSNCLAWQGTIWIRAGNNDKACEHFEKAREEASTDEDKQDANEFIKTYCQNKNNR